MRQFRVIICLVLVLCVAVVAVRGQHSRRRAQPRGPTRPPEDLYWKPTAKCPHIKPKDRSVKFYLYDKEHHLIPSIITKDKIQSRAFPNMNLKRPYKFLIHGYNSQGWKKWTWVMKEQYLKKGDYIIIVVDWSAYACSELALPNHEVSTRVEQVAQIICDFLLVLMTQRHVNGLYFHLIGHGVGAHVAGRAGHCTRGEDTDNLGRITGLDPASVYYDSSLRDHSLQYTDAQIVDVIHTGGELYGWHKPAADYDFYPNGGKQQPGCSTAECSHSRAIAYFIESINSRSFEATYCDYETIKAGNTCANRKNAIMGDNLIEYNEYKGSYYIKTNSHPPFARGSTKA